MELTFVGEYEKIPQHMRDAIGRYILGGTMPGDFLTGIITNDLKRAVFNADETNLPLIKTYVMWFHWEAPGNCWGSPEVVKHWVESFSL